MSDNFGATVVIVIGIVSILMLGGLFGFILGEESMKESQQMEAAAMGHGVYTMEGNKFVFSWKECPICVHPINNVD